MKYEIERVEAMDRAREMEPISQMKNQPPKIERAELSEGKEQPPKLDCSDIKLGGTVTEMMTEMKRQDIQRMKEQLAIRNGNIHMKEDYEARKEKLQAEMDEMRCQQILRRTHVNYGTPTTEEGWKAKAATEFRKNGESSWYNYCMDQAAKCHVDGK